MSQEQPQLTREQVASVRNESAIEAEMGDGFYICSPSFVNQLTREWLDQRRVLEQIAEDRGTGYSTHDICYYCRAELPKHTDLVIRGISFKCPTVLAREVLS